MTKREFDLFNEYWYYDITNFAGINGYEVSEYGPFLIGQNILIITMENDNIMTFILTGYNNMKNGCYRLIYKDK